MMDKKCLEAEQIQLFIDDELSSEEAVRIKEHLALCNRCHSAIESAREFDEKLQQQFVSAHSGNDILRKVMEKVRELKAPVPVSQPSRNYFSFKWLPAFAIALIVILAIFKVSAPPRYSSEVGISFVAADDSSTIDGVRAGTTYRFPLEPLKAVKPLSGKFVFEQKLATDTIIFKVSGNVGVRLTSDYLIDFSGTHGNFVIDHTSGSSHLNFTVNSGHVQVLFPAQKLGFSLATKTLLIEVPPVEVMATETTSIIPAEKIDEALATPPVQVVDQDSAEITDEKVPEVIHIDIPEPINTDATGSEGSGLLNDRPNPFVDAPIGIGGGQ